MQDESETDTCDHYRETIEFTLPTIPGSTIVKVDIHDEGHRGIDIKCLVEGKMVGSLSGRFKESPSDINCPEDFGFEECECQSVGLKWEDMKRYDGSGGNILYIEDINVEIKYRLKGIGRIMAQVAAKQVEAVGCRHILLIPLEYEVRCSPPDGRPLVDGATAFWRSLGYRPFAASRWHAFAIPLYHPSGFPSYPS